MIPLALLATLAFSPPAGAFQETASPVLPSDAPLPDGHVHPVLHLVRVASDPRGLLRLGSLDLDVIRTDLAGGEAVVLVTPDELTRLDELHLETEVLVADLAAAYARRLADDTPAGGAQALGSPYGQWLIPPFGQGGMGGYYTFPEIESVLDQLRAAYPDLVSQKTSIGSTLEGRSIWMVRISDNPDVDEPEPEVRIDAMHHSREPQGMQTTIYFVCWLLEAYGSDPLATYLVDEREIYVLPCVNPDGYEHNRSIAPGGGGLWRKNRRDNGDGTFGVDLNRNYSFQWGGGGSSGQTSSEVYRGPSPASEPETQAMIQFLTGRAFETALSVHTFSDLWLAPWGYVEAFPPDWDEIGEIGDLAVEESGYPHGPAALLLYTADGVTVDYDYGSLGTYSWTPEIGSDSDGFWPSQSRIIPLAEENRLAFARTTLAGGAWVRPQDAELVDAGDGDGAFEGGESVEFTVEVRNSGRGDAGSVLVELATSSGAATITAAAATVVVPSFASETNATPLRLEIAPGTPTGTVIPYTLTATEGGRPASIGGEITVGARVIAFYDFEAVGDQGWGIGSPGGASTGEWTRDDPIGTSAQPENDFTPGAGTQCWFTGQGSPGGSLGGNDVDGGRTTLLSPAFDLSSAASASIRYARWYSNDEGAAPNADVFEIALSDDDGATWVEAEVIGPAGSGTSGGWIEAQVDVDALVDLTDSVRIRFVASDLGDGSIVEAAIDDVAVVSVEPDPCPAPANYCVLSPNAWTAGAVIGATGSTDVSQNDLTLTVTGANPSGFGLFFYGQGQALVPTGNGSLCVGGSFQRLPAVFSNGSGAASYALDLPTLPTPIAAGETWNFQYWLRDVGGASFNFSDGLSVTFCP